MGEGNGRGKRKETASLKAYASLVSYIFYCKYGPRAKPCTPKANTLSRSSPAVSRQTSGSSAGDEYEYSAAPTVVPSKFLSEAVRAHLPKEMAKALGDVAAQLKEKTNRLAKLQQRKAEL